MRRVQSRFVVLYPRARREIARAPSSALARTRGLAGKRTGAEDEEARRTLEEFVRMKRAARHGTVIKVRRYFRGVAPFDWRKAKYFPLPPPLSLGL